MRLNTHQLPVTDERSPIHALVKVPVLTGQLGALQLSRYIRADPVAPFVEEGAKVLTRPALCL